MAEEFQLYHKNPFGYRWLWFQTFILAIQGLGRAWTVLTNISRYQAWVEVIPVPLYVSAWAVWGIIFAKVTWAIWRRRRWAIRWLWQIQLAYAMFALAWMLVFVQAPYERQRLPFVAGLTLGILIVNLWLIKRRRMQAFFGETL